jgi:hypothetical protein
MSTPTMKDVAIMATLAVAAGLLRLAAKGCYWVSEKVRRASGAARRVADYTEKR